MNPGRSSGHTFSPVIAPSSERLVPEASSHPRSNPSCRSPRFSGLVFSPNKAVYPLKFALLWMSIACLTGKGSAKKRFAADTAAETISAGMPWFFTVCSRDPRRVQSVSDRTWRRELDFTVEEPYIDARISDFVGQSPSDSGILAVFML